MVNGEWSIKVATIYRLQTFAIDRKKEILSLEALTEKML
jgi:hypothetical protein